MCYARGMRPRATQHLELTVRGPIFSHAVAQAFPIRASHPPADAAPTGTCAPAVSPRPTPFFLPPCLHILRPGTPNSKKRAGSAFHLAHSTDATSVWTIAPRLLSIASDRKGKDPLVITGGPRRPRSPPLPERPVAPRQPRAGNPRHRLLRDGTVERPTGYASAARIGCTVPAGPDRNQSAKGGITNGTDSGKSRRRSPR